MTAQVNALIFLLITQLSARAVVSGPQWLFGASDASAVVSLDEQHFVVGDDEDNVLRVYHRQKAGQPVFSWDSSSFLQVDRRSPESDLEGAARIGNRIYWITSHGRSKSAQYRQSRHRFFATEFGQTASGPVLYPVGVPYLNLNEDITRDPGLKQFGLSLAATRAPKAQGAFNIEGLSAAPDGKLLIGFRNPVPAGKALLVPLLNPEEAVLGKPARLGDPILLELHGLGIRSMTWIGDRFIITAGSYDSGGPISLYEWDGAGAPPRKIALPALQGLNLEGVDLIPGVSPTTLLAVSDDGTLKVGKRLNKRLKKQQEKRSRLVEIAFTGEQVGSYGSLGTDRSPVAAEGR